MIIVKKSENQKLHDKLSELQKWKKHFAWLPVCVEQNTCQTTYIWLRFYWRRLDLPDSHKSYYKRLLSEWYGEREASRREFKANWKRLPWRYALSEEDLVYNKLSN